jgi:hypothetical protein
MRTNKCWVYQSVFLVRRSGYLGGRVCGAGYKMAGELLRVLVTDPIIKTINSEDYTSIPLILPCEQLARTNAADLA